MTQGWNILTRFKQGLLSRLVLAIALLGGLASGAHAVPTFAVQTGQPCQACHVGGFGPQLTPFGRNFKLNGYTMRSVKWNVPFSAMVVASYLHTAKDQSSSPAPGYGVNDNFGLDQASLFLAGGVGSHFGGFAQATYDGVAKAFHMDNLDVRAVTTVSINGVNAVIGLNVNNAPTVQDAWNTTAAWGFPYTSSSLAPTPAAGPITGALAQTTMGVSAYAWIDQQLYLEFGVYQSPAASFLVRTGVDPADPGSIKGGAPYARIAWQKNAGTHNFEVGASILDAHINPGLDVSTGLTDHYMDLTFDGSYQLFAGHNNVVTFNARYTHEHQDLHATAALANATPALVSASDALAPNVSQSLDDLRFDASYYWHSKVGLTVGAFDTWGSTDPVLYSSGGAPRPNSSGMVFQIDGTPFGNGGSPFGPRANIRVGIQYFAYFSVDGSAHNIDGMGRNAGDNNAVRIFTWIAY